MNEIRIKQWTIVNHDNYNTYYDLGYIIGCVNNK